MLPQVTTTAPLPCNGNTSLYYSITNLYEINARWLTGIKSIELHEILLSTTLTNYHLSITGMFKNLPLSLAISECFTPDVWITGKCRNIWDNLNACCGNNKHFHIQIITDCVDEYPYIRNITMQNITLDRITIEEELVGMVKVPLSDITETVSEVIKKQVLPYLNDKPFIPWGKKELTLGDIINRILLLNSGAEGFKCRTKQYRDRIIVIE